MKIDSPVLTVKTEELPLVKIFIISLFDCSEILTDVSGRYTYQMKMKATDMVTITAAKAKVTPTISATRPFSAALCRSSSSLVVAVELACFFSSVGGTEVVDLRSLSSGLGPNCKEENQLKSS